VKPVVFSKDVCSGEPRIDSTRLTCSAVASILHFQKFTLEQFLCTYPYLTREDVRNCLRYCASQQCVADKPINFCQGCILDRREEDAPARFTQDPSDLEKKAEDGAGYTFLGGVGDLIRADEKQDYWRISERLRHRLFGD
jgi:uncharacterized protein (DUF433 family)